MEDKRIAIITGGSSGIGLAIARKMIENQVDVTLLGRRESALKEAALQLGEDVHWIQADVGSRADVERAISLIKERAGTIDILINNAGCIKLVTTQTPIFEAEDIWDEVNDANLKGTFLMTMAVAPHLRRPGGRIINISSIGAYTGGSGAGSLAYSAAKSGLHGLTFATARELSGDGITVNAIAPGFIDHTNLFQGSMTDEGINRIIAQTPAGRTGYPEDIAAAVWFLVSPEASYITGEILNVNGGWLFGR